MPTLDNVTVRGKDGDIFWFLIEDKGEYLIVGEGINMKTKTQVIGTDRKQAEGIFKRLFKKE